MPSRRPRDRRHLQLATPAPFAPPTPATAPTPAAPMAVPVGTPATSALRLTPWRAPGRPLRLYLNGHDHEPAKIWLEPTSTGVRLICSDRGTYHAAHDTLATLLREGHAAGTLPAATLTQCGWAALVAFADAWRPPVPIPPLFAARLQGASISGSGRGAGAPATTRTADLDPRAMAHPLPAQTVIRVDHRERAALLDHLVGVPNLVVQVAALDLGDMEVLSPDGTPVLVIERKTPDDFVTSMTADDQRLFTQAHRLSRAGCQGVLLLEGALYDSPRATLPQLTGALSYLTTIEGLHVMPTVDLAHTAYTLVKLARHAVWGLGYDLAVRPAKPSKDPSTRTAKRYVLEGIPGVSATLALALLDHFGSIAKIAAASVSDLRNVPGVGPTRAAAIQAALG